MFLKQLNMYEIDTSEAFYDTWRFILALLEVTLILQLFTTNLFKSSTHTKLSMLLYVVAIAVCYHEHMC